VARVSIDRTILDSQGLHERLRAVADDPHAAALILRIDSPGEALRCRFDTLHNGHGHPFFGERGIDV